MKKASNTLRGKYFRRSRSALALLLLAAWPFGGAVQAVTIDFSTAPFGLANLPFSEDGFTFTHSDFYWQTHNLGDGYLGGGGSGTVRLTRTDNGLFDLSSLDVTWRSSIDALGTFGLSTSAGGSRDLSAVGTYTFSGAGFEGLSWVDMTIVMGGVVDNTDVDNIVVNNSASTPSVPDAGSTGLLLSGVLGTLGLCQRRLRRA